MNNDLLRELSDDELFIFRIARNTDTNTFKDNLLELGIHSVTDIKTVMSYIQNIYPAEANTFNIEFEKRMKWFNNNFFAVLKVCCEEFLNHMDEL